MKRLTIITLLLLVAAFSSLGQNLTGTNLDVRNTSKLRGLIYPFGAVATTPINTSVHEVAMINNSTFALCRMDFEEFADSIANHLNPIIGTHWYTVAPDTIKTLYNVVVDSSATFNKTINIPTTTATVGQIKQGGVTVFHTYSAYSAFSRSPNLFVGDSAGNFTNTSLNNTGIGFMVLNKVAYTGSDNTAIGTYSLSNSTNGYQNTAVGAYSLYNDSTGYANVAIGRYALITNKTGINNVAIGTSAGESSIGDRNVYLGHYAGKNNTSSDKLYIENSDADSSGALIFGNFVTNKLTINGDLTVTGLATTSKPFFVVTDANGNFDRMDTTGWKNKAAPANYWTFDDKAVDTLENNVATAGVTKVIGNMIVTGQITYDYKHLIVYTSGGSYNPNVTQNVEFRLLPGFSTTENDGFTFAGDSIVIITPGDYYINFATVFQAANGDDWLFKCRKNGVAITTGNLALTTTGAGNYSAGMWFWYVLGLVAGDRICFTVTGENVGSDDPTFRSIKVYMKKEME